MPAIRKSDTKLQNGFHPSSRCSRRLLVRGGLHAGSPCPRCASCRRDVARYADGHDGTRTPDEECPRLCLRVMADALPAQQADDNPMGDIGKKISDFFSGLMPKDEPAAPRAGWLKTAALSAPSGPLHPMGHVPPSPRHPHLPPPPGLGPPTHHRGMPEAISPRFGRSNGCHA